MSRYFRNLLLVMLCSVGILSASAQPFAQVKPPEPPPAPVTPFGLVPTLPPVPPQPPQAAPDDISELQKCYKALDDRPTCQRIVAEQATWDVRFFELKYADPYALRQALSIFRANINVSASNGMNLLSVKAPKEIMPAVEDAIKRLDVPPPPKRNVELTVYVLKASDDASASPVPQSLQPVINQLRNVFPSYKQIQLADTVILTGLDGQKVSNSGRLPFALFSGSPGQAVTYSIQTNLKLSSTDQKNATLRLDNFGFTSAYYNASISTVLDVPFGQQVVVGKATAGDSAIILVLSAKLL